MERAIGLEAVTTAILLAIAFSVPRSGARWFRRAEGLLGRLAHRRLSIALVGLAAFMGSAAVSLLVRTPQPMVHDEFSYLLAADTFASGRLTNPTHPMWMHFESFHIIHQPTYASKYPPGQGLVLAAGQALGGHPIVGVWLGMGLAGAALTWMLQAWVPPWWALVGGLLAVVRLGPFGYWSQSYWGGAVAAIGGALVLGGLRRITRRPQVRQAVLMGLGLAILANTRPYEGLLMSLAAAAVLLVWMIGRTGPTARVAMTHIVLPTLVVLTLTGCAMGFYNVRVTGDPLRMPYQVHEERYSVAPIFTWQSPRAVPAYRHKVLHAFHMINLASYLERDSFSGLARVKIREFARLWTFYLGPALTVPLVMLPWVLKERWMRVALLIGGVVAAGLGVEVFAWPHYAAPITGLVFVLVVQAMRRLRLWRWRDRPTGRSIVWAILLLSVLLASQVRSEPWALSLQRARILEALKDDDNRHLVIVRYRPWHSPHFEWVYNAADIDAAKVVWAREMGEALDRRLLEYFKDRVAWLLEADATPPRLTRYTPGSDL